MSSVRGSRAPPSRAKTNNSRAKSRKSTNSGKASYRPLATAGSQGTIGRGLGPPPPGGLGPLSEEDGLSLSTVSIPMTNQTFVARDRYKPPEDPDLKKAINTFHKFLDETGIESVFNDLCRELFEKADLPYNPYPGFARRFRWKSEGFHIYSRFNDREVLDMACGQVIGSTYAFVYRPLEADGAWGIRQLVAMVNVHKLHDYEWMVNTLTPTEDSLVKPKGYSNQVMVALTGPVIFHGTFYETIENVAIRMEYLITGRDFEVASNAFIKSVYNDIIKIENSESFHIFLGANVLRKSSANEWYYDFWTFEQILENRTEFWKVMAEVVSNKKYINAECVFCTQREPQKYARGQKQYSFNFVEVVDNFDSQEVLQYLTDFAYITLHEGIFLKQAHAEAYLTIFTPRLNALDKDLEYDPDVPDSEWEMTEFGHSSLHPSAVQAGNRLGGGQRQGEDAPPPTIPEEEDLQEDSFMGSRVSINSETDEAGIKRFRLGDREPRDRTRQIKFNGFQKESAGMGPYAWQIIAPIKSTWQRSIARSELAAEFFDVCFYSLMLYALDPPAYNRHIIIEIFRALHSTASRLNHLMMINKTVRDLVLKFEGLAQSRVVNDLFAEYKEGMIMLFNEALHERSSDYMAAKHAILAKLEDITNLEQGSSNSVPLIKRSADLLKDLNSYVLPVLVHLCEDLVAMSPWWSGLLEELKHAYADEVPQPIINITNKRRDKAPPQNRKAQQNFEPPTEPVYTHGVEELEIMRHEQQVINVEDAAEQSNVPKSVAKESVFLRYTIDTHLDKVWPNFLIDILFSNKLPLNPYPKFITYLRQSAMRMDLCYEPDEKVLKKCLHGAARVEDAQNFVYHIPGCDAHGYLSPLQVLDTTTFTALAPKVQQFFNRNFNKRKGVYRIALCTAISGFTPLFGKMDPYLKQIELHEHCYIKGPDGCYGEGVQIYSKIVHKHMVDWYRQDSSFPALGVYMGDENTRWSLDEIYEKKKAFAFEFENHINKREPVYCKAFLIMDGWRLVPVVKRFHLHYVNEEEIFYEVFYKDSIANLYQNVFLDKEKAAFHHMYGGPSNRSNPHGSANLRLALRSVDEKILEDVRSQKWVNASRWLLQRNLMTQGTSVIVESWRMLHSIAAQLEYTIYLGRSIQDMVLYAMELRSTVVNLYVTEETYKQRFDFIELILGKTATAFRQKMENVCRGSTTMAARCLARLCLMKFTTFVEREESTNQIYVDIELKSVTVMEEICQMLQQLQDALSHDVYNISPQSQALVKSIKAEAKRPSSVESAKLDDHLQYTSVPQTKKWDTVDNWDNF